MRLVAHRDDGLWRGDVDDRGAGPSEMIERLTHDIEGAVQVDVDDDPESVRREIVGLCQEISRRTRNQYVDRTEAVMGAGERLTDRFEIAHVGRDALHFTAIPLQCLDGVTHVGLLAAGHADADDVGVHQPGAHCYPNSARRRATGSIPKSSPYRIS
jgi:hypothetical protein